MKERLLPLLAVLTGITLLSLNQISAWGFPRGPYYFVGSDVVCNDAQGCREVAEYKEDRSGLDSPAWVEFSRDHWGWLFLSPGLALTIGGFVSLARRRENPRNGIAILAVAFAAGMVFVYAILSIWDIVESGWMLLAVGAGLVAWGAWKRVFAYWPHLHPKNWTNGEGER